LAKPPKWFLDSGEKSVKQKANEQEKSFAKRMKDLGAKQQPVSGALWFAKGDVKIGDIALGDNKQTIHSSFSITAQMWKKISEECVDQRKLFPFLQIEMKDAEPLVVISEGDFEMLLEAFLSKSN